MAFDTKKKMGKTLSEKEAKWLKAVNTYIDNNLSDTNLSVLQIAQEFNMSESTFLRKIKALTGQRPVQYLQEYRLKKGEYFLEQKAFDSISKVATEVGYRDVRSFSRVFKKHFGKLPSELLDDKK